ncbi:MAG: UPF0182 family protein [Actinomycetaceae bacterium]|nr:UPF0182 family protein [Actinomycetaceae bacterium]
MSSLFGGIPGFGGPAQGGGQGSGGSGGPGGTGGGSSGDGPANPFEGIFGFGGGDGEGGNRITFSKPKIGPVAWVIIVLALLVAAVFLSAGLWTEIAWYTQLERARVIFTNWGSRAVLFVIAFLLAAGIIAVNGWLAHRGRKVYTPLEGTRESLRETLAPLRKLLLIGAPIVLGIMVALPMQAKWQEFQAFVNQKPFGTKDPIFSLDASFYVFTLPALEAVITFFLMSFIWAIVLAAVVHYMNGEVSIDRKYVSKPARIHLSILAAILALVLGVRYWVSQYGLLLGSNPKFDGATYTHVHAMMPARSILAGISVVVAILFIVGAFRKTLVLPGTGLAVMVLSALVVGGAYPALIQRFQVDPSAQELESKYIQHNINATRKAYDLEDVKMQQYSAKTEATPGQLKDDSQSTASIRLLDPTVVSTTFRQLEQNKQYYNFASELSVDRYEIDGKLQDTVIAVRELDQRGLGANQHTWVNDHTVYTHGFGVVAAYGNKVNTDGAPHFWEQGIPSTGALGEYEPRIYFGQSSPLYSIVGAPEGASPQEFDYPDDRAENSQHNNTFAGDGGPTVSNLWERLLYAIRFQSSEIFFSKQVNAKSQILFDRDPVTRINKVAPYLTLDGKAYPAVVDMDGDPKTPKRVVWIVDAFTTTDSYPYSAHTSFAEATADSQTSARTAVLGGISNDTVNYVRNSVKAVVDAYDGSVTLYQWGKDDPVLETWKGIFPNQVKPTADIPGDLMAHLRYPADLFKIQRDILARYHVMDARSFYSGSDFWKLPDDPTHEDAVAAGAVGVANAGKLQPPYYLTMKMPGQEKTDFSLYSTYIPYGNADRNVLTGYLAVDSETGNEKGKPRDGYGTLRLMQLPTDLAVPGPGQVSNQFKSTDRVATTLNLLAQNSTTVVRANLLTIPVGGGLLYVQPIYVQAKSGTTYPLLRSVLVSFGDKVGFKSNLQDALDELFGGDSGAVTAEDPNAAGSADPGTPADTPPVETTAEQQLRAALQEAKTAMEAAHTAMTGGDWAAYGEAQKKLQAALEKAVAADTAVNGATGADKAAADGATPAPTEEATKPEGQ